MKDDIIQPYYQKMRRKGKKTDKEFDPAQEEEDDGTVLPPVQVTGVAKIKDILKNKRGRA